MPGRRRHEGRGAAGIVIKGRAGFNRILNCEVSRFWSTGIGIGYGGHDNVVRNCRVYDNCRCHWPRDNKSSWGGGISVGKGTNRNNLVEGNFVYWNHGEGIVAGGGVRGTVIRRNVVAGKWLFRAILERMRRLRPPETAPG